MRVLSEGAAAWNRWRAANPGELPDLSEEDLAGWQLIGADLSQADLRGANLRWIELSEAKLAEARLNSVDLLGAFLDGSDLRKADLGGAHLYGTSLRGANLEEAGLSGALLSSADLSGSTMRRCQLLSTHLVDLDLRTVEFLDEVRHFGPSPISTSTLRMSQGRIPRGFLKGCGFQDWEILAAGLYIPDLPNEKVVDLQAEIFRLRASGALQIGSLFISYSHHDTDFVEALEARLQAAGIRHWRDVHDLGAGRVERQIDRGMRLNPTVLLVLSAASVESDWVEWEAARARELEKSLERDVLCPVALDTSWKSCSWPGPLRGQIEKYHVVDFSQWNHKSAMDRQFGKLIDGLSLFYEPPRGDGGTE